VWPATPCSSRPIGAVWDRNCGRPTAPAAGTRLVRDINPGPGHSSPARLTGVGATLYFIAHDGTSGRELWKSDGTSAGTRLVKDLTPGGSGTQVGEMTGVGSALFFVSRSNSGWALWKSDGSEGGTRVVKDGFAARRSR
jgi:ELWxxDGT repeat protein